VSIEDNELYTLGGGTGSTDNVTELDHLTDITDNTSVIADNQQEIVDSLGDINSTLKDLELATIMKDDSDNDDLIDYFGSQKTGIESATSGSDLESQIGVLWF